MVGIEKISIFAPKLNRCASLMKTFRCKINKNSNNDQVKLIKNEENKKNYSDGLVQGTSSATNSSTGVYRGGCESDREEHSDSEAMAVRNIQARCLGL